MESYAFETKQQYRKRRNLAIDRANSSKRFRDRRIAYLDTREGLDTINYLQRGYRAKNLWAINREPVEVALLTQKLDKLGLPRVNTVGLDFEEALETRVPEVDVIDFDGMSNLHGNLIDMLRRILENRPKGTLGITILAARETRDYAPKDSQITWLRYLDGGVTSFDQQINIHHEDRLDTLLTSITGGYDDDGIAFCSRHVTYLEWDVYMSTSKQPMLWCVVNYEPHHSSNFGELLSLLKRTKTIPWCGIAPLIEAIEKTTEADKKRVEESIRQDIENLSGPKLQRVFKEIQKNGWFK